MNETGLKEALNRIEKAKNSQSNSLDLGGLDLTELPEVIEQLKELEILDLMGNEITELPESIGQFKELRFLNLMHNPLKKLPESIVQLKELRDLNLVETNLTHLPENIGQLTNLQSLLLMGTSLPELPESIAKLTNLRTLYLDRNPIKKVPTFIGKLINLQKFSITQIKFNEDYKFMRRLTNLQMLYLDKVQLSKIPEYICDLINLRTLYLDGNNLTELPEDIGRLVNLKTLSLSQNRLISLPKSIIKLKKLAQINLHSNPQLGLPIEILGNEDGFFEEPSSSYLKPREIIDFYFRVRENGRPLNEAKLILVGRGTVGKTSLVNRLIHDKFNPQETKTEGIQIDKWKINLTDSETIKLNVWDFGGQEIMHATHQFFLTERSLYLLVLNGREGAEDIDAEYWLKLIDSFGGQSPVIVVLNKRSDHHFDLNRRALLQKYPNIKDFIKTDCKEEIGINELRMAIKRETNHLDDLRVGFPSEWFAIKDKLSTTKKNYLSFEQFRGICRRNGVGRKHYQETLAKYLNQLGIVLNYKDDARLRDTHVLNPRWVTEGIYKILNSAILEKNKGEIRLYEISQVLSEKDYPHFMCRFIFDLMKKFYLCFSFPNDECHYLIPELLGKEEPEETEEFIPEKCLNFQYHYSILTEGILPRFIVRTNVLSEGLPRWRSGVILEFEGCRALIKADIADRKVSISVLGENPENRRRLLAIIRSDFERIHNEIRNLEVKAMVPLPKFPNEMISYDDLLVMEREGKLEIPFVVNYQLISINVKDLLNGVDLQKVMIRKEKSMTLENQPIRLFYSYTHKDENFRNELETHLKILNRRGLISSWHDRKIDAGEDWKRKIDENLASANIILLLVSADFIASEYCWEKEMKYAMERHEKGEATVIPIVIRDTNWKGAPFAKLQALPRDAKPVTTWDNKDSAWRNVSEGIESVVEKLRETSKGIKF